MSNPGKNITCHLALGDFGLVLAKGDFASSPAKIEHMQLLAPEEPGVESRVREFFGVAKGKYVRVAASFSPASRFLRKATVESAAKVKSPNFLSDLMQASCKINPDENEVAALLPGGGHFDAEAPAPKELLFVGALTRDVSQFQSTLIGWGLYPVSIELTTLSLLASTAAIASAEGRKSPTLILEIGEEVSHIYILNNGSVDFCRQVPFGFKSMLPQIKSELGLADEVVARKILSANTFDFTEMAPMLLRRLVKEIQASVGFYEVQTGYATGQIFLPGLPARFGWVLAHLARALSLDAMQIDLEHWAARIGVQLSPAVLETSVDAAYWPLISQAGSYE